MELHSLTLSFTFVSASHSNATGLLLQSDFVVCLKFISQVSPREKGDCLFVVVMPGMKPAYRVKVSTNEIDVFKPEPWSRDSY